MMRMILGLPSLSVEGRAGAVFEPESMQGEVGLIPKCNLMSNF